MKSRFFRTGLCAAAVAVAVLMPFYSTTDAQSGGVIFKTPDGYFPVDFPEKERAAVMMIDPKTPSGMFGAYQKDGEAPSYLTELMKKTVGSMFFQDGKSAVNWSSSDLPPHPGFENEKGTAFSATNGDKELQLVEYIRIDGEKEFHYGYFGMRHLKKPAKDDAKFIDAKGKGVDKFDKFWKSITVPK